MGHPLHPAIVHVPVGFWLAAMVFDLLLLLGGGESVTFYRISFYAIVLGTAGAVVVAVPGLADWSGIKREKPAWKLGLVHLVLNVAATVVWGVNGWVRLARWEEARMVNGVEIGLSAAGTVLLLAGVWFGKRMTFDQGTSVGRQSREVWRKRAREGKAALPEE